MNLSKKWKRPQIVIIGAGFGGLSAAKSFKGADVDVLLIDRNNYHTFLPLLYQVAAAEIDPSQIGHPIRSILRSFPYIDFLMAEVSHVNFSTREVVTSRGTVPYNYLILATGSVPRFFDIPGVEAYAFTMKSMEDGITLRNHILTQFEEAGRLEDPTLRRQMLTFTVIGGGPSGVEFAGALTELIRGPLAQDFPELCLDEAKVILIEASDKLLGFLSSNLGHYALKRLEQMGVEVFLNAPVARLTAGNVRLRDGAAIPSRTIIWTAGVGAEGIGERSNLDLPGNKAIPVLPSLQINGYDDVYAVGDFAAFEENGAVLSMVAPVAIQQGELAALNIQRQIIGKPLGKFSYRDKGTMAVIGRNAAVAEIGEQSFTGFFAWLIWLVVHLIQLIGFRNRVFVLLNWAWNYLTYDRMVRLILPGLKPEEPADARLNRWLDSAAADIDMMADVQQNRDIIEVK